MSSSNPAAPFSPPAVMEDDDDADDEEEEEEEEEEEVRFLPKNGLLPGDNDVFSVFEDEISWQVGPTLCAAAAQSLEMQIFISACFILLCCTSLRLPPSSIYTAMSGGTSTSCTLMQSFPSVKQGKKMYGMRSAPTTFNLYF